MIRFAAALLLTVPGAVSAEQEAAEFPAWLAGGWTNSQGDRWTEEFWTHRAAG